MISSAAYLKEGQAANGSGWESNPPGAFADATPGLKPVAVTRAAYTPDIAKKSFYPLISWHSTVNSVLFLAVAGTFSWALSIKNLGVYADRNEK